MAAAKAVFVRWGFTGELSDIGMLGMCFELNSQLLKYKISVFIIAPQVYIYTVLIYFFSQVE